MPIYISRGRFTSDAVKGMLAKPENREEATNKLQWATGYSLKCKPMQRMFNTCESDILVNMFARSN